MDYIANINDWKDSVKRWKRSFEISKRWEFDCNQDLEGIERAVENIGKNIMWKMEKDVKLQDGRIC